MNKSTAYQQGFTLIELLVVILIIGILAAIALPRYQKAVEKARFAAMLPVLQSLVSAQQQYYLMYGSYATNFNQLDFPPSTQTGGTGSCPNWNAKAMRQVGHACAAIVSGLGNGETSLRVTELCTNCTNDTQKKKAAQTGYYYVFKKSYTLPQAGLYCTKDQNATDSGHCKGTRVMDNAWGKWYKM